MRILIDGPADSAGELYVKTPVTPEEIFQAIGRLRKEARDEIDRLIRFLDETDNHMEREPDDEGDGDSELEQDDPSEDDSLSEPSLGAFEGHDDQRVSWKAGTRSDRELDAAESGIGDGDGLLEQIGRQDWQSGVMA
jgi:hypothetical protein